MSKFSQILTAFCALLGLVFMALAWLAYDPAEAQISPEMRSHFTALMQTCRGDFVRFCGGVRPGGGRILACFKSQAPALSPDCAKAIAEYRALKDQAAPAGGPK